MATEYPIEDWSQEDVRNLRDTLASPTWQKVLNNLTREKEILEQIIFSATVGTMTAVAELSHTQGQRQAMNSMLDSLTVLSIPESEDKDDK